MSQEIKRVRIRWIIDLINHPDWLTQTLASKIPTTVRPITTESQKTGLESIWIGQKFSISSANRSQFWWRVKIRVLSDLSRYQGKFANWFSILKQIYFICLNPSGSGLIVRKTWAGIRRTPDAPLILRHRHRSPLWPATRPRFANSTGTFHIWRPHRKWRGIKSKQSFYTEEHPISRDILFCLFEMVHWLLGWCTSYCAAPLAAGTSANIQNKTSRVIGCYAMYRVIHHIVP